MQTDAGLATAMRISITRLARRLRVERLGLGGTEAVLSDIQLAALAALERHDAMTPGELAEHEKVQPPSMTRVIAVLEERGLVRRAAHPTDRRQVILTVTQQGRDLVQLVRRRREAWLAQRMQELTPEERATLLAAAPILEKLSQSLGGGAQPPGVERLVPRLPVEGAADQVDLVNDPARPLVAVEGGDHLAHIDGGTAAGEGQVRGECTVGVVPGDAGPAPGGGYRRREVGQRATVARHAAPQHVGARRFGERARARHAKGKRPVPPGGTLKPGRQAGQPLLAHLAEEGEREVPELSAGPAQVIAGQPERGAHRV
jgi:DNA-binding MarR family transcriptional regulator